MTKTYKVYFAGPYGQREILLSRALEIEVESREAGVFLDVTASWLQGEHEAQDGNAERDERDGWAQADRNDIRRSDALIQFIEVPSTSGGAHFEFGYADALGKHLFTCGPLTNVFHDMWWVCQCPDWDEAKAQLIRHAAALSGKEGREAA